MNDGELRFDDALGLLPRGWQAALSGCSAAPAGGMGGAAVFQVTAPDGSSQYLKLARGPMAAPLREEIARTAWLSSRHVRVPELLMTACTDAVTAILMTAVPGRRLLPGTAELPAAVRAMGRGLARLHALPAADCPFDEMPRTRLARARQDIDRNLIDPGQFDDRNAGVTPDMLYRRLAGAVPAEGDVVVVHGDAAVDNMLIGPDGEIGFIDCGAAGRSDRYLDLAVAEDSLRSDFGQDAAETFISAYGIRNWDHRKAAFFRDLYEFF